MARLDYNQPSTRERVHARRKNKSQQPSRTVRPSKQARPARAARPARQARRQQSATPGTRQVALSWVRSGRIASLVLFIGALAGLFYVFSDARFTVQDVEVEGAEVLRSDQVIDLADALDEKIWYVDRTQIVDRLKTSAYIEDASVNVALPDKLFIRVVERRPEMRWASGGQHYLVDGSGRVLGEAEATGTLTNTLVINDQSNQALKPNDRVDSDALAMARLLSLRLPAEVGMQPISINWSEDRGVFVLAPDNKTVIFGRNERLDEKLTVLDTLLKQGTVFTFLDLRPTTPFYRNEQGAGD